MLEIIEKRNPKLVEASVELHQSGAIPPDCYVVDLDMLRKNVKRIKGSVDELGLNCFVMTKQFNRNPSMISLFIEEGLDKFVAVDYECAYLLNKQRANVSHVGHLVQIPRHRTMDILEMSPEIWTVYGYENAVSINAAAQSSGVKQNVLLKVIGDKDAVYTAQEGGIPLNRALEVAERVASLPNLTIVGVTGFYCTTYDFNKRRVVPTPNMTSIKEAADMFKTKLGLDIKHINAPGNSSIESMRVTSQMGATDTEPGSALWGMCPQQLFGSDVGEPAQVYVSEISHYSEDTAQVIGGGFYPDVASASMTVTQAFVGNSADKIFTDPVKAEIPSQSWIDYYSWLYPESKNRAKSGDTVIYFFRPQVFKTRSANVATLSGIQNGRPQVEAIYDRSSNSMLS
jgi:predicted amino acid racemase